MFFLIHSKVIRRYPTVVKLSTVHNHPKRVAGVPKDQKPTDETSQLETQSAIEEDDHDDDHDDGSSKLDEAFRLIQEAFKNAKAIQKKKEAANQFLKNVKNVCSVESNLLIALKTFGSDSQQIETPKQRKEKRKPYNKRKINSNTTKKKSNIDHEQSVTNSNKGRKVFRQEGATYTNQTSDISFSKNTIGHEGNQAAQHLVNMFTKSC